MDKKKIILIIVVGAVVVIAGIIIAALPGTKTTLEFRVTDSVSSSWVYNSTIRLQGHVIRGFKRTDFIFKNLKRGQYEMTISAPHYETVKVQVNIKNGKNRLKEPVVLKAYEIEGIVSFNFHRGEEKDKMLPFEIRLIGKDGHGMPNHPCLDIRLLVIVSKNIDPSGDLPVRGERLYTGIIEWEWNTSLDSTYRYTGQVSTEQFTSFIDKEPFILDNLLFIPDPRKISTAELDKVVRQVQSMNKLKAIQTYIESLGNKISFYSQLNIRG